jgi:Xaa-Pro aminopeptidase
LFGEKLKLVPVDENLVDAIWQDRPSRKLAPIRLLEEKYAGRSFADKVAWLRREHIEKGKGVPILLSALDEIACTHIFG